MSGHTVADKTEFHVDWGDGDVTFVSLKGKGPSIYACKDPKTGKTQKVECQLSGTNNRHPCAENAEAPVAPNCNSCASRIAAGSHYVHRCLRPGGFFCSVDFGCKIKPIQRFHKENNYENTV